MAAEGESQARERYRTLIGEMRAARVPEVDSRLEEIPPDAKPVGLRE
jgi:hypothetical protein